MKLSCAIIAAALLFGSCSRTPEAVPRPRAYPRAAVYPDSTVAVGLDGVSFRANAGAEITHTRADWADIAYPYYNATVYVSVSGPLTEHELAEAIANRRDRIGLNLAGRGAREERFRSAGGFVCSLTEATEPAPVPLQFVAVSPAGRLVSGAVAFSGPVEPADSLAPALERLRSDVDRILESLSER